MTEGTSAPSGPDLSTGLDFAQLAEGAMVVGHVGLEAVLLVRCGEEIFALGASCSHYHGPLNEGLVVGDTVRCPWHHACFSLRTGEPLRAPALDPVACWRVEGRGKLVYVREKGEAAAAAAPAPGAGASAIDRAGRRLQLEDGSGYDYDKLLIATGADPTRLDLPGSDLPHVHYLRSPTDSRAIIAKTATARSAVVIGASFIGLEVAAALRMRQLEVHVVAP